MNNFKVENVEQVFKKLKKLPLQAHKRFFRSTARYLMRENAKRNKAQTNLDGTPWAKRRARVIRVFKQFAQPKKGVRGVWRIKRVPDRRPLFPSLGRRTAWGHKIFRPSSVDTGLEFFFKSGGRKKKTKASARHKRHGVMAAEHQFGANLTAKFKRWINSRNFKWVRYSFKLPVRDLFGIRKKDQQPINDYISKELKKEWYK